MNKTALPHNRPAASAKEHDLFPPEKLSAARAFHATRDRCRELIRYRALVGDVGSVRQVFLGDSITEMWPLHEFFPSRSLLNRGVGGDNVYGLYDRLRDDVLRYRPERVFMLVGINGIEEPVDELTERIVGLAERIRRGNSDTEVFLSSILPLRAPDAWDRFQYQGRIADVNRRLRDWAGRHGASFLDYHAALRDETGQLAAPYALEDGTHITFEAYCRMAEVVRPYVL